MKISKIVWTMISSATVLCTLQSQTKETVILYNSVPVEVEVTNDGEITRFKKERPDYLQGYTIDTKADPSRIPLQDRTPTSLPTGEQGTAVPDSELIISFSPNDAGDMDGNSLDVLNSIIGTIQSARKSGVILRAASSDDPTMIKLNNERLANCKKYIISQGILAAQVTTTLSPQVTTADQITVEYQ